MSLTSRILLLDVTENGPCGLVAGSGMSALGQKLTACGGSTPNSFDQIIHFATKFLTYVLKLLPRSCAILAFEGDDIDHPK